jgi:hypothetical protein
MASLRVSWRHTEPRGAVILDLSSNAEPRCLADGVSPIRSWIRRSGRVGRGPIRRASTAVLELRNRPTHLSRLKRAERVERLERAEQLRNRRQQESIEVSIRQPPLVCERHHSVLREDTSRTWGHVPKVRAPLHEARSIAILSRCCPSGKRPLAAPKLSIM